MKNQLKQDSSKSLGGFVWASFENPSAYGTLKKVRG
jgi:hypothetical protein